ncbi:helix-turn-helix transcriptional regulator [Alicyclobacillus macrosporangiidus]|uniref:Putative transcriptional regulator n=1 Tax=Alicyclobacillus macrosporangiidus TaxID=392015 RepID=A0A1I7IAY3_9BACL|nr:helix-turn-helix transcriptional regulator [Alicyclobacillus macrosporangiidus]SFU70016.1 putative transcriptional regulator [Alicyclobacillus macrosporangiidus]
MNPNTRLVERRKQLNLTQEELARKANISRAYLANIEAGRRTSTIHVAKRIADALQSTVDYLFTDSVPKGNEEHTA